MKRHALVFGSFLLVLIIVVAYPRFSRVAAQADEPYVPSGILVSDLEKYTPPGRLNVRFPPRDPEQAGEQIRQQLSQPQRLAPLSAEAVPTITAEIQTLAAGLENNPLAIYDYVRNHIDYVPSYGLLKNPRETLLAEAGNAYDQAALLSALLNAAGYSTHYVWGTIQIGKPTAMNWVGAADPSAVGYVFANGGIPTADAGSALQISHIWIEVFDQGTWHLLDPSFKSYQEQSGEDLRPRMGFTLTTFLARAIAGATVTPDYVQNINGTNIRSDLSSYALNLINSLRSSQTFASLDEMIGGRRISPIVSAVYPPAPPYTVLQTLGTASNIPNSLAYTLNIQLPGINYTANINDIAGERITIFYECATAIDCDLLNVGGGIYNVYPAYQVKVVPKLRVGGVTVATGSAVTLGTWDQPFYATITAPSGDIFPTTQYLTAGAWYALPLQLQTVSAKMLARHTTLLNEALAQGLPYDDERVLGESLNILGLAYFTEVEMGDRIDNRLAQVVQVPHFALAITSRDLSIWVDTLQRPVDLEPASHSIDVRLSLGSIVSAQNPANALHEVAWMLSSSMRGSATEHAIHEQLRPVKAISTIQALKLAADSGQRIYYITPANQAAVIPLLGAHDPSVINSIIADLSAGQHILISQSPITYGQWQGSGWISLDPETGAAGYLISGGLGSSRSPFKTVISGGSGTQPEPASGLTSLPVPPNWQPQTPLAYMPMTPDPIDIATGSFIHQRPDLSSLGGLGLPLSFERFYASAHNNFSSTLGFGWTHTYNTRFYTSTDWTRGFGDRMAIEAAPALASAQVGFDLFAAGVISDPSFPRQRYTIEVLAAQWLMMQITGNAITWVDSEANPNAHVRLSDGTYQPPAGGRYLSNVTIAGDGSATLNWRDGTRMQFNSAGRPITLDDANNNRTTLTYDAQGRLRQVTDAVNRSLIFTYTAQGLLNQFNDPLGRLYRYSYDSQANLKTFTDPRGGVITYTYDTQHRLVSVTDQLKTIYVTNTYDALGRAATQLDGRGGQTRLLFGGDQTIVIDPLNTRTTYFFDEQLRWLGTRDALGYRTMIGYDAADHEISRTTALSQTTQRAYDTWGNLIRLTDTLGYTHTWGYDTAGFPTQYSDPRGKKWQWNYDAQHNLITVTNPLGNFVRYDRNGKGQVIQARDAAGVAVSYGYDTYGNQVCRTNALAESSCWVFDRVGRPTSFTNGVGQTTLFTYDANSNLLRITDPLGYATRYGYNAANNLVSLTTPNNYTTTYAYDAHFNLIGMRDAQGNNITYTYNANDLLIGLVDANKHATLYQRDPLGQIITVTDALNRSIAMSYDAAGQMNAFLRADGSRIAYQRDGLGRLIGIDYPSGADTFYRYAPAGNVISATYGGWSALYQIDDANQIKTIADSRGLTTTYTYDPAGRRSNLRVDRGATVLYDVAYSYDAAARLARFVDQTGVPTATVSYLYDNAGRIQRITDPGGARADYGYDAAGHITQINHVDAQNTSLVSYQYIYDPDGNAIRITDTLPSGVFVNRYAYDPLDRLTAEILPRYTISYTYDAGGNLTNRADALSSVPYTYDAADQLLNRGTDAFGYDANGNLVTWQNPRGTYTHIYDYQNHLISLTLPGNTAMSFTYDAFGRRLTAQDWISTRGFLNDDLNILLEGNASFSQTSARYLYGNDWLAARYTNQLGFTSYHSDALENVRYLIENNSGQPIDAYRYDAYGRPALSSGIDPNPFRFVGQRGVYQHQAMDWPALLMGFRYYEPMSQRFLTRDPLPGNLAQPLSLNDYLYAFDNPLTYNDPSGLRPLKKSRQELADAEKTRANVRPEEPSSTAGVSDATSNSLSMNISAPTATRWGPVAYHGASFALICTSGNQLLAGAFQAGLFQSNDAQHAIWNKVHTAGVGEFSAADASTLYAGARYGGVLKSSDDGQTWTAITNGLTANDVYAVIVSPTLPSRLYAGTEMGLFVSSNGGGSWGRSASSPPGRLVPDLAYAGSTLLAATDVGLYLTTDNGVSWHKPTIDLPPIRINTLVPGSTANTIYAGTAAGLYRSTDQGNTWAVLGTGLNNIDVRAIAIDPANANHMVAGTSNGLYISQNGGAAWTPDVNAGLSGSASQIGAVVFCPAGGDANLYLGTGRGVYALRTPVAVENAAVNGPATGATLTSYTFIATVSPITTTVPVTYTWQASSQTTTVHTNGLSDTIAFTWPAGTIGSQLITATADNGLGSPVIATRTMQLLGTPPVSLAISGPITGAIQTTYSFTATVGPAAASKPVTYTWTIAGQGSIIHAGKNSLSDTVSLAWNIAGSQTFTVTAQNAFGAISANRTIYLKHRVYLPLILRQ